MNVAVRLLAVRPLIAALAVLGALALVPAAVAARGREGLAPGYLATTFFCLFVAGLLHFGLSGREARMRRVDGLVALAVVWLAVPLAAMPSIAHAGHLAPLAAWLEAVSAFTATGLTALKEAPASLYIWLALLQWAGGLVTIVSAVAVLAPAGLGGLPNRAGRGAFSGDGADALGVVRDTAPTYLAVTALALVALLVAGHTPYAAFCLATAATSAGGHLPPEARAALLGDGATRFILLPFLLWAATSVRWHRALVTRRIHAAPEQRESLVLIGYWLVLGILLGALLVRRGDLTALDAVRDGLFTAASLISTSGIGPTGGSYALLPMAAVMAVALLGGGALSVAGGLKVMRLRAMALRARGDLTRLIYPHLVQAAALDEGGVASAMRGIWVASACLFGTLAVMLVGLSPGLPNFDAALAAAAAVVSNTGPVYDLSGAGWPPLATLPPGSVILAGLGMIAGRLEIIGLFVVVHIAFWRN